ncbi:MAG: hypothetical protein WDO14_00245 [Bacteroidota bacterium]
MEENDDSIRRKIRSLNNDFPKVDWERDEVWDVLTESTENTEKSPMRYVGWSIAAALIITAVIFFLKSNKEKVTISYRQEVLTPDTTKRSNSWSLIEETCKTKVVACESKEFIDLKTQWEELHNESESLEQQEKQFGENPAISKAKQKVESIKEDLEKEMLSMIKS